MQREESIKSILKVQPIKPQIFFEIKFNMKTRIKPQPFFLMTLMCLIAYSSFSQAGYFGEYFRHQCRDTTQFFNYTLINNPTLNGNPLAQAIFTPFSAMGGVDENYHSGLYYNSAVSKWAIYNENHTIDSISLYSTFNILVPSANGASIKHTATALNTSANLTFIDDPATNNKPNALLYISHNWGASGGVYNNHATGVFYHQASGKWGIFNEDLSAFPVGAVYNVFVVDGENDGAYIHTTGTPSGITPYISFLTHPGLNSNSVILVTHNFSPAGISNGRYDTSTVGVGMKSFSWLIQSMDKTTRIDSGTTFNVLIADIVPSGVDDFSSNKVQMNIYPNPANSEININYETVEAGVVSLKLYEVTGSEISVISEHYESSGAHNMQLPVDQLTNGMYILAISLNGNTTRRPIVVVK